MCTKEMSETQKVIASMLTENTGRSFLDSGGTPKYDENGKYIGSEQGYGRAYERNQGRDFLNEKPYNFKFSKYGNPARVDIDGSVNLFHFLDSNLEYLPFWDRYFNWYVDHLADKDWPWMACMYGFAEHVQKTWKSKRVGFGPYGDGGEPSVIYTYNEENFLSQDIQFLDMTVDGESVVLLQVHNGCDARGGLTKPRAFRELEEVCLYNWREVYIECQEGNNHRWVSENAGYSAMWDGDYDPDLAVTLPFDEGEKKKIIDGIKRNLCRNLDKYELTDNDEDLEEDEEPKWRQGFLHVDEDDNAYCPICGGRLEIYAIV